MSILRNSLIKFILESQWKNGIKSFVSSLFRHNEIAHTIQDFTAFIFRQYVYETAHAHLRHEKITYLSTLRCNYYSHYFWYQFLLKCTNSFENQSLISLS